MILRTLILSLCLTIFSCHGLEIKSMEIIAINPSDICNEKISVDDKTSLFSNCEQYEFINQYIVFDTMSINDFHEFITNYQLGSDYQTTIDQELLRHFDAMISPFDSNTKVIQHKNLILFKTKNQHSFFQRNDGQWLLTKAILMTDN